MTSSKTSRIVLFSVIALFVCLKVFYWVAGNIELKDSYYYKKRGWEAQNRDEHGLAVEMYRKSIEEAKPKFIYPTHFSLGKVYYEQGKFEDAVNIWMEAEKHTPENDMTGNVISQGEALFDQGKETEARIRYERLFVIIEKQIEESSSAKSAEESTMIRLNRARSQFFMYLGEYEKARDQLEEILAFYLRKGFTLASESGSVRNDLAYALYLLGQYDEAREHIVQSTGSQSQSIVPFPDTYVKSVHVLSLIERKQGFFEKAEKALQSGITFLKNQPKRGVNSRVEQADLWTEIGYIRLLAGKTPEARTAFRNAGHLRVATQTDAHPNYADVLNGLAIVSLTADEFTSASELAARALSIVDSAVVPTHPRIARTLLTIRSLNLLMDMPEKNFPYDERLDAILENRLGFWKDGFLESTAFWESLLRERGFAAEADELKELRIQREGRP